MRVKVISRSTDEFTRERSQDLQRVFRNFDPSLRTQEKATEYVRALNAAKLEKVNYRIWIQLFDFLCRIFIHYFITLCFRLFRYLQDPLLELWMGIEIPLSVWLKTQVT